MSALSQPWGWWREMARRFWADQFNAAVNARNIPAAEAARAQYDRYAERAGR